MFVLVPFVAWLVARARRRSGRRYPAHLVFTLHVYAAAFGVRAVTAGLGAAGPPAVGARARRARHGAVRRRLHLRWRSAAPTASAAAWRCRDTAIVTLGAWLALMAGTGAVVAVAVFGRYWLRLLGF